MWQCVMRNIGSRKVSTELMADMLDPKNFFSSLKSWRGYSEERM